MAFKLLNVFRCFLGGGGEGGGGDKWYGWLMFGSSMKWYELIQCGYVV